MNAVAVEPDWQGMPEWRNSRRKRGMQASQSKGCDSGGTTLAEPLHHAIERRDGLKKVRKHGGTNMLGSRFGPTGTNRGRSHSARICNPVKGRCGACLCQLAFYRAERKTLKTMVTTGRLGAGLVRSVGQSGRPQRISVLVAWRNEQASKRWSPGEDGGVTAGSAGD